MRLLCLHAPLPRVQDLLGREREKDGLGIGGMVFQPVLPVPGECLVDLLKSLVKLPAVRHGGGILDGALPAAGYCVAHGRGQAGRIDDRPGQRGDGYRAQTRSAFELT